MKKIKEDLTNQELNQIDQNGPIKYIQSSTAQNKKSAFEKFPFLKKLKYLDSGSARIVFLYNNKWIIKIALGEEGRDANESEVNNYEKFKNDDNENVLAKIIEYGDTYVFIIMEKVNLFKSQDDFDSFFEKCDNGYGVADLIDKGLQDDDLHWKNFGYIDNLIKLIDYHDADI